MKNTGRVLNSVKQKDIYTIYIYIYSLNNWGDAGGKAAYKS